MQHKYNNDDPVGRFEFREEYWEQALALIEADEARKRKRRRMLLWWSFASLLLISAGFGWWRVASSKSTLVAHETTGAGYLPDSANVPGGNASISVEQQQNSESTHASSSENASPNKASSVGTTSENTATSKGESPSKKKDNYSINTNSNEVLTNASSQKRANKKRNASEKSVAANPLSLQQLPTGSTQKSQRTEASTSSQDGTIETEIAPRTPPTSTQQTEDQNAINPNSYPLLPTNNAPQSLKKILQQLFALPLPFPEVKCSTTPLPLKALIKVQPPMAVQIKPVHDKRLRFGVLAAATINEPAPDLRWLGFMSGIFGEYKLNPTWSASIGLALRYQPGSWLDSSELEINESLMYSFGYTSVLSERRTLGLLSTEIPIAAHWHRRAFGLEVGVAPGRLILAIDRFKQITEASLEGRKTTRNRLEKNDTAPYGKLYSNAFAGAEWRFSRNASIALRGNYRFGTLLKATDEDPVIKAGPSLDIGLRWKIF